MRHGLSPAELARIFGRSVGVTHTRLSRARDHLEEALTAWILLRLGRRACPALARLVGAPGHPPPALTPDLRRALRQHLEGCATCQETRWQHWSAAEWLGAVGILPPPPEPARAVRERLSQRAQALTRGAVAPGAAGGLSLPGLLQGLGILLLIGTLGLGLSMLALGLLLTAAGSAEVRVENRNCPPLVSPSPVVRFVSRLSNVEVPAVIPPGGTAIIRLLPGTATLARSEEGLRVEAYG
ncbi:hypothetical protein [Thermoflexus sp.]|uniref:hypothetical protein n=1 Tax=Thermoflexus sp. TaxID=1969742 RepID=UPI0035E44795